MTLSQILTTNANENRSGFRLSWKTAALFGVPVLIAGVAGASYYFYKRCSNNCVEKENVPKTPLETAIALKNRGNKFFKAGQYDKAVQLYDEGLGVCPDDAITERAALYQNRAAAKENLRQYDSAIVDCNSALELSPRYLKALNRRAHLHEKLEAWEACLPDVVACCIFEEFKNADNIICMDQTLKKIGQIKAKEEWTNLSHALPSDAFIKNYLSAFAWNPFAKSPEPKNTGSTVNGQHESNETESSNTSETEKIEPDSSSNELIAETFREAANSLEKALKLLNKGQYEASMGTAATAVSQFEHAMSSLTSTEPTVQMADGDDKTVNSVNTTPSANGVEVSDQPVVVNEKTPSAEQLTHAKVLNAKAILLHATYMALAGRAAEAKQRFQTVFAEGSGADAMVRVNALIKSACLSMSVDQDFAACLYDFQNAQNTCPECPDVYLHRGQINLLADQLDEALHDLNTAVKLKPEFSIAQAQRLYTLYRKALSESNADRAASRIDEFRRLAQKYPNCLETHSLYAQVLTERGDFSASDEEFGKVIDLAPNSGLAYAHRGLLQLRWKQDRDTAYKWFTLGSKADPKCELIHELLGQLAVEQGDFTTALEHFNLAIREAKTQNDLAHLLALREGVQAQYNVCQKYQLSISDVVSSLRREQQQMMMGMA